jgi:hypothetical protein
MFWLSGRKKYRVKIISALVLLAFFGTIFAPFQYARAAVPNYDVSLNPLLYKTQPNIEAMIASLHLKEVGPPPVPPALAPDPLGFGTFSLDSIAYNLGRLLLRAITNGLIQWIKTGDVRGGPLIVEDFVNHFERLLDNAAGLFLEEYLDPDILNLICSPFRIPIGRLVNDTISPNQIPFSQKARCTLTDIIGNIEDFQYDFLQGGWPAWFEIVDNPSNTAIGSYFIAIDEAERKIAEEFMRTQLGIQTTGGGAFPQRKCDETSLGNLVNCVIVTPGRVVADAIGETFGIDIERLQLADEISEVIAAALDALVSWAITGGGTYADYDGSKYPAVPSGSPSGGININGPDSIPTLATIGSPLTTGTPVTFSATVKNDGNETLEANTARFCLTSDGAGSAAICLTLNDGDVESVMARLGNVGVPKLTPGASAGPFMVTWDPEAGTHTLFFCTDVADPTKKIAESNEDNNCTSETFTVE